MLQIKNKYIALILILLTFSFYITPLVYADSNYIWDTSSIVTSAKPTQNLELESESAILIDQSTGQILYEKDSHKQLRPASVTKVMTLLLIMEAVDSGNLSLNDQIPCSERASSMGGSQIWLDPTETLSVHEMLKAICVVSANDCTVAMAEHLAGSEEQFVKQMNQKAKDLGMNDTTFKNCHGIDEDGHLTSAYDISLMSRELLSKHPTITNYTTIWMDSLRDGKSELVNTNKLIRNYLGATGLKTGSTSLALYNLSASATRDNLSLIAVVMRAPNPKTRFADASKLLNYGFTNYIYKSLGSKNDIIENLPVTRGVENNINAILESDSGVTIPKSKESNISINISLPESIEAPISSGQSIGKITYSLDNEILGESNIIAEKDIAKETFVNTNTHLLKKLFNLFR